MVDDEIITQIMSSSLRDIACFMSDKTVTEIMVTADGKVWVEALGAIRKTNVILPEANRVLALIAVGKRVGRDVTADTDLAVVSTSIAGNRFAGARMPIDPRGTTLCIRKHLEPSERPSLEQLIDWKMLTQTQADLLVQMIIVDRKNAVFVGATSSGKTTLMNAIISLIPDYERIGVIEDAQELAPKVENCDRFITNAQTGVTAKLLIQHSMRSRYDRILLGESRGDDTFDLIRALSSGHNGSVTSLHASSALGGLDTLEMLYQMSIPVGANIPVEVAKRYISSSVNLIIYTERSYVPHGDFGESKSVRCVKEICLVKGVKDGNYEVDYL